MDANSLDLWLRWNERVESVLMHHKPHTRDELDLRLGQKLFNMLGAYSPNVQDKIRGSIVDPFHNDDMVPAFLEKVDELWML